MIGTDVGAILIGELTYPVTLKVSRLQYDDISAPTTCTTLWDDVEFASEAALLGVIANGPTLGEDQAVDPNFRELIYLQAFHAVM